MDRKPAKERVKDRPIEVRERYYRLASNVFERQAMEDELTGLGSKRALRQGLDSLDNDKRKEYSGYCVVVFDLDGFKGVNDTYGHAAGDRVLCAFAKAVKETLRKTDDIGIRNGGDEFVILLKNTDAGGAYTAVKHIRGYLDRERSDFSFLENLGGFSAGITYVDPLDDNGVGSVESLEKADKALYEAKRAGKNRVGIYQSDPTTEDGSGDYVRLLDLDA